MNEQAEETIVKISNHEMDDIVKRICVLFGPYDLFDIFISLKVKDY